MKLRLRLGLTLIALTLPLAAITSLAMFRFGESRMLEAQAEEIRDRMSGARTVCEERPAQFPRFRRELRRELRERGLLPHGRMGWLFAYDRDFHSRNEDAPAIDAELRAAIARGEEVASRIIAATPEEAAAAGATARRGPNANSGRIREILVPMDWEDGPCALVLVHRPHNPPGVFALMAPTTLVGLGTVFVALLAAGPLVRRIRRLTLAVERARSGGPLPEDPADDELGGLARAFAGTQGELREKVAALEARDAALSEYIANTTHDVMLPLTVLQGHLLELRTRGDDESERLATLALEESHYLAGLVHNLNAAARLDAGKVALRSDPVDLGALVERVIQRHAPIARNKDISLDHAIPEDPLEVIGDLTLLEQAVSNLVHNAVRHNDPEGHVAVVLERERGGFSLRVLDDGPGADPAELERLTQRGYRGDRARTLHPEGRGLGLAITREVIERHGLTLAFDAPEEGGLEVMIRGAIDRRSSQEPAAPRAGEPNANSVDAPEADPRG